MSNKNPAPARIATFSLITLFSLTILFHLLVISGIIPYNIIWGGRIESQSQMYLFESISIIVNIVFLLIIFIYAEIVRFKVSSRVITTCLWIMTGFFLLNTLGNLLSVNSLEKAVFTPATALISVLIPVLIYFNRKK